MRNSTTAQTPGQRVWDLWSMACITAVPPQCPINRQPVDWKLRGQSRFHFYGIPTTRKCDFSKRRYLFGESKFAAGGLVPSECCNPRSRTEKWNGVRFRENEPLDSSTLHLINQLSSGTSPRPTTHPIADSFPGILTFVILITRRGRTQ